MALRPIFCLYEIDPRCLANAVQVLLTSFLIYIMDTNGKKIIVKKYAYNVFIVLVVSLVALILHSEQSTFAN